MKLSKSARILAVSLFGFSMLPLTNAIGGESMSNDEYQRMITWSGSSIAEAATMAPSAPAAPAAPLAPAAPAAMESAPASEAMSASPSSASCVASGPMSNACYEQMIRWEPSAMKFTAAEPKDAGATGSGAMGAESVPASSVSSAPASMGCVVLGQPIGQKCFQSMINWKP